jgi:glyoxylase-like metal-dependent hydrolase (beta-lactamase superfamily II)
VSEALTLDVGEVHMTRVPYFDVPLDPAAVGLSAAQVLESSWSVPVWATETGKVLVGQAVWVLESAGRLIVIDPCCAADPFLRDGPEAISHQDAVLAALTRTGISPEHVDVVALSHLDGIGMAALVDESGSWRPAFPAARVVLTSAELSRLDQGGEIQGLGPLRELIAAGVVDGVPTPFDLAPHVSLHLVGGHTPGHAVVRVESGSGAVFVGHLALSPIHLITRPSGDVPPQHSDEAAAIRALAELAAEAASRGTLLVGPLWPYPGVVGLQPDGRPRPLPA